MSAATWVGVALLGGVGAVLRHVVDAALVSPTARGLPLGIFVVNISGAFALGLLAGSGVGEGTLLIMGTGLLGAFTTFSTWMLQTTVLLRDGRGPLAATYVTASVAIGFLAVVAGRGLA